MNQETATARPTQTPGEIELGSPEFWALYDQLCTTLGFAELVTAKECETALKLRRIIYPAYKANVLHELKRPEKGWKTIHAWVALKGVWLRNYEQVPTLPIRPGDVVIRQWGYDREGLITQIPYKELMSKEIVFGKWEESIGLFLPLFDAGIIETAVKMRLEQNRRETEKFLADEKKQWTQGP